jgi:RimJ/RimL family protein N-acetyltransferase
MLPLLGAIVGLEMTKQMSMNSSNSKHMDQPLGDIVLDWTTRSHPTTDSKCHILQGQYCRLDVLNTKTDESIIQQLFDVFKPIEDTHFTYLRYGPFKNIDEFRELIRIKEQPESDTLLYSIQVNAVPLGFLSFLRINPVQGTIEIGNINFSERLARTRAATEAIYLLLQLSFDVLNYRRVEWKCNALNRKSRQAAIRFGFQYEGTWIKVEVCKGHSRDSSWYSIVDDEWPLIKQEFERWLNPTNFDAHEQQLSKLNAANVNARRHIMQ